MKVSVHRQAKSPTRRAAVENRDADGEILVVNDGIAHPPPSRAHGASSFKD